MELKDLKYFVAIADQQSMHKAAVKLYVTQPNLSRSMKNLEREIGTELFVRSNHGVKLTVVGESLYSYAQSIIKQMEGIDKLKEFTDGSYLNKELKLSLGSLMLNDDILYSYFQQLNTNNSNISLNETSVEEVLRHVANLTSEIGLICINEVQESVLKKLSELNGLELHQIGRGPILIHVGSRHPLYGREEIRPRELLPFTYIHLPLDFLYNYNNLIQLEDIKIRDFSRTMVINNYHAIINMVKRTDAFIFGNKWQVEELEKGHIGSIRLTNCNLEKRLYWVKRKKELLSEQAEEFLKMIIRQYGDS